jgi:hypothetical protein
LLLCRGRDSAGRVIIFLGCVGICRHGGGVLVVPRVGEGGFVCCVFRASPECGSDVPRCRIQLWVLSLLVRAISVN